MQAPMIQSKFTISQENLSFLEKHAQFGFKDKSEAVRTALDRLRAHMLREQLRSSAELYADLYTDDEESQEWIGGAVEDWPE
jgi:Arc/MetJ-type ribon-helix-helix transcriptional regulator